MNPLSREDTIKFLGMFSTERPDVPQRQPMVNAFVDDYSRVIMSAPVRRLKDKAQVFPLEQSDYVRTRLTHSLEVAHFGRLLGLEVERIIKEQNLLAFENDETILKEHWIPQILEVAGLVHDIGNPPFGHFGEQSIREYFQHLTNKNTPVAKAFQGLNEHPDDEQWCQLQRDFLFFDGNVQGFRILRHLALAPDNNSYNLTKTTLATIVKYPYSSVTGNQKDAANHCQEKFGYFQTEEGAYEMLWEHLHLADGQRHPLTYLLEAADDIANAASDMEDGWKLQYITFEDIKKAFVEENCPDVWKIKISELDSSLSYEAREKQIQKFRIDIQTSMVEKCAKVFCENLSQLINNQYERIDLKTELVMRSDMATVKKALQKVVQKTYDAVISTEILGGTVITKLLDCILDALFAPEEEILIIKILPNGERVKTINMKSRAGKIYSMISTNYREAACAAGEKFPSNNYAKFMLATDYVSGMTDNFALDLYHQIYG